jgi:hypothetical protein
MEARSQRETKGGTGVGVEMVGEKEEAWCACACACACGYDHVNRRWQVCMGGVVDRKDPYSLRRMCRMNPCPIHRPTRHVSSP